MAAAASHCKAEQAAGQSCRQARNPGMRRAMEAALARLAALLPDPARRMVSPARLRLLAEFLRFGTVGTLGFVIDTATVYALARPLGLYGAGAAAYLVAASTNWAFNRAWTFRGRGRGAAHWQWARFISSNALGFLVNRGAYAALIAFSPSAHAHPVLAVAAGAIAGLGLNFAASRHFVFR